MTKFVIHGIPGSPYVRTPLVLLEEKGLPWRLAAMPFGGQHAPEHKARQPFGKIPAFEHGDFALYETQAFLRYVDRIAPEPAMIPAEPRAEARMNQLIGITDSYVAYRISGAVSFPRLVAPMMSLPVDEAALRAALPAAAECLAAIAALVGDTEFLVGDAISLADCMLIPHLVLLPDFAEGRELLAPHPMLAAWVERMAARPSVAATDWRRLRELTGQTLPAAA